MEAENNYKGQFDYLQRNGYLEDGADIALGKQEWRKFYKKVHRRQAKKVRPEVVVILPSFEKLAVLKQYAKDQNRSMSRFLWECAEQYMKQQYLQVHVETWNEIQQNIALTRLSIQKIQEDVEDGHASVRHTNQLLLEKLMALETVLAQKLNQPELITKAIEALIIKESWQKEKLLNHIKSL